MIFDNNYITQFMFETQSAAQEQLDKDFPGYTVTVGTNGYTEFFDSNDTMVAKIKSTGVNRGTT